MGETMPLEAVLPLNLRQAFRAELHRAFHSPYEAPLAVLANALLTTSAWFLLPNSGLFTLHGALAFPVVLASWMYSDVPATNVLGGDASRVIAALDDPMALWRMLVAKSAVLWILVVPTCSLIAIVLGAKEGRPVSTVFTVFWIAIAPLGALGLSAFVGIWFPYHPIALRERWDNRKPFFGKIVRWVTLTVTPYIVVPYLAVVVALPSIAVWGLTSQRHGLARIPDRDFALGTVLGCLVSAIVWLYGLRLAVKLAIRRQAKLKHYLANPDLG